MIASILGRDLSIPSVCKIRSTSLFTITSNRINIKMIKTASDNVSFIQNRKPAETTLEDFQDRDVQTATDHHE